MEELKSNRLKDLLFISISVAFALASLVCVICNLAVNRQISWSLYVVGSCAMVWLSAVPFFKLEKYGILLSLIAFSILTIPFLFLVEAVCSVKDWAVPLGVPAAALGLVYLWLIGFLLLKSKISKWYILTIAAVLSIPLNVAINMLVSAFSNEPVSVLQTVVNVISSVCLAVIFFYVGFLRKKKTDATEN